MARKTIGTVAYLGGVMSVPEVFCWSLAQMIQYNNDYVCLPGEAIHYDRATVSYHAYARNTLVDRMKGDWLLMLDTDHRFDPDILGRMLFQMDKHGVDVLTAIYQYKNTPHSPVIYAKNEKGDFLPVGDWDKDARIFEVASSGAGCLLVKREVFKRIKTELKESPFDIIHPFSEDHSFFKRLDKLGIKPFCDPHIECNHLSVKAIGLSDYDRSFITLGDRQTIEGRV